MKETRNLMFPIIGRIQHGEQLINNGKKQVKEYGYFIAKIQESAMQPYLDKFNSLYKGKTSIDVKLLDTNTFTKKRVRYNQGGQACYSLDNQDIGKVKVKKQWQDIECNEKCEYLKKDENGKALCNRIAWLKFFIPEVSNDRIWLMKITGQASIDNIDAYLQMQQKQGNSLNNTFTLFLTKKEQVNFQGKIFTNCVLDIIKKEDFISNNQIQTTNQIQEDTKITKQETMDMKVVKEEKTIKEKDVQKDTKTKKKTKSLKENSTQKEEGKVTLDKCYVFESLSEEKVQAKSGEKTYTAGRFYDTSDNLCVFILNEELSKELSNCELGTMIEIQEAKEFAGKKFITKYSFIEKMQKNIAA